MTMNPSSSSSSSHRRQRPPTGKLLSATRRSSATVVAAIILFLLLTISVVITTAESYDYDDSIQPTSGGIDTNKNDNQQKDHHAADDATTTAETDDSIIQNEPSSSSSEPSRNTAEEISSGTINSPTPKNTESKKSQQQQQPTANTPPKENFSSSSSRTIQSFQTLFTPQIEEYTLTKFDPYSFSGAPLGGWGRATRSRLASLPIRLVSDYGGGLGLDLGRMSSSIGEKEKEEVFKRGCEQFGRHIVVDTKEVCVLTKEGLKLLMESIQEYYLTVGALLTEETLDDIWAGAAKEEVPNNNNNNINNNGSSNEEEMIGVAGFLQIVDQIESLSDDMNGGGEEVEDPTQSTGGGSPHFTLRDGMGRQFVCRVYDEGELEVESYMNSMFSPAVQLVHSKNNDDHDEEGNTNGGKNTKEKDKKEEEEDVVDGAVSQIIMDTTLVVDGEVVDGNVAEALTSKIRNLLEDLELNNQFDADNIVIDIDVEEGDNHDISDIVKAAMKGAGLNNNKESSSPSSSSSSLSFSSNAKSLATELTADEIFDALKKLRGTCSQLHLGWWSYEWCHDRQVRQFHVEVSPDPTAADGRKYDIVDVTVIGHYHDGVTQIIKPVGKYNGELKMGSTRTYIPVGNGDTIKMKLESTSPHSHRDDHEYSKPFYDREKDMKTIMSNRLKNEMQDYKLLQTRRIGHSTEIVKQQFSHGDMCDEVGIEREVSVEYRCCTEREINHWLNSKRRQTDAKKDEDPLAVLVSVQETDTCIYQAKICTPVLCPESLLQAEVAPSPTSPRKPATTHDTNKVGNSIGEKEAIESVHRALKSAHRSFRDEGGVTEVKVIIGGEETAEAMKELIRAARNGEAFSDSNAFRKVTEAMGIGKQKIEDSKVTGQMDGRSIREVLGSTLDGRPCLQKNLGWWTYEYCHGKNIKQYHVNNLIDPNTGAQKVRVDSSHILGKYTDDLKYSDEDEHLHVVNVTGLSADMDIGRRNKRGALNIGGNGGNQNEKGPGGNGAVFVQEYMHGDSCDHEDVAESVIKGGNIVHGSIERSTTVRFSCGKSLELVDIKEDSTCHYIIEVAVPALCNHPLFMAPVTKTQVVKCLPV